MSTLIEMIAEIKEKQFIRENEILMGKPKKPIGIKRLLADYKSDTHKTIIKTCSCGPSEDFDKLLVLK